LFWCNGGEIKTVNSHSEVASLRSDFKKFYLFYAGVWFTLIVFFDSSRLSFNEFGFSCVLLKFSCELKTFVDVTFRETFRGTRCFEFVSLEGSLIYSKLNAGCFRARPDAPKAVEAVCIPVLHF
jgi:hypothetical protein